MPSLELWPRCGFVEFYVSKTVASGDGEDAASRLTLTFSRLVAQRREQITIAVLVVEAVPAVATGPVASLAAGLPNLRELSLHGLQLACDPPQLSQLYNALASLPHLEALSLPSCAALAGISRLAGSERLCHLKVCEADEGSSAASFGPQTLAELSQLRGLRRMAFVYCRLYDGGEDGYDASLRFLLANPPPSLGSLDFLHCTDEQGFHVQFNASLCCGRLCSVDVPCSVPLPNWLYLAQNVLLPSLAPGQRLERLGLSVLDVAHSDASCVDAFLLRTLRQRCADVELGALAIGSCTEGLAASVAQAQLAWRVQELLQSPLQRIEGCVEAYMLSSAGLQRGYNFFHIEIGKPLPGPQAEPPCVTGAKPLFQPSVDTAATLWMALQRMAALWRPAPPPEAEAPLLAAAPPAAPKPATLCLLLLHGPFVDALWSTPYAMRPWLDSLPWYWRHGVSSGPAGGGAHGYGSGQPAAGRPCDGAGDGESFIRACQPLPSAGALLLAVEARGLRWVAAAARAAASHPGCAGWGFTLALEAVPLAGSWEDQAPGDASSTGVHLRDDLFRTFEQVLQGHWDEWIACIGNPYGRTAAGRTQAALEMVFSVRDQLSELLPPILILN